MTKIKVTAVSYLNTKPLLYGLLNSGLEREIELSLDIPALCADKLQSGEADLGLIPVAAIPGLGNPHIISDFCIGAVGAVKTVAIYGNCPIEEMKRIYLDHHSRTSVILSRWLLRDHWRLAPELIAGQNGYIDQIGGKTGGLVIGDRSIGLEERFDFTYDLGTAWQQFSSLPFVFAAWVSSQPLPEDFVKRFNEALRFGIEQIPKLVYLIPAPVASFDLSYYFTHHISYELDAAKKEALTMFLKEVERSSLQPSL